MPEDGFWDAIRRAIAGLHEIEELGKSCYFPMVRKIPCLFVRGFAGGSFTITEAVTPGCEWAIAGEGEAYIKLDGSGCLVEGGRLYARREWKSGKPRPDGWIPAEATAGADGDWQGWQEVTDQPRYKWHREAWSMQAGGVPDGTYELCGPKVNKNNDGRDAHWLYPHTRGAIVDAPRSFSAIREWLESAYVEGIVYHHDDGRMAKIRRGDFGFDWPRLSE